MLETRSSLLILLVFKISIAEWNNIINQNLKPEYWHEHYIYIYTRQLRRFPNESDSFGNRASHLKGCEDDTASTCTDPKPAQQRLLEFLRNACSATEWKFTSEHDLLYDDVYYNETNIVWFTFMFLIWESSVNLLMLKFSEPYDTSLNRKFKSHFWNQKSESKFWFDNLYYTTMQIFRTSRSSLENVHFIYKHAIMIQLVAPQISQTIHQCVFDVLKMLMATE